MYVKIEFMTVPFNCRTASWSGITFGVWDSVLTTDCATLY